MKLDDRALPLTRRKLDMRFAQVTSWGGTEWQLGLFTRIGVMVNVDLLKRAISKVLREAEPLAADFFETDGRVFQKAIDYPDVELAFYGLSCSRHSAQEAPEPASSIQTAPTPFAGPLLKYAFFRTRRNEYRWFSYRAGINVDGLYLWVGRSLDRHYPLSDRPIGTGVIMPSNARHSDRGANGRRCVCSTRPSQRANRIQTRLLQPPDEKAVSGCG